MDSTIPAKLSPPLTDSPLENVVNRVRADMSYVLLSDPDAQYALLKHFSVEIGTVLTDLLTHFDTLESTYNLRTVEATPVDLSETYNSLTELQSVNTQLGAIHLNRAKARIERAIVSMGGITPEEARSALRDNRLNMDALASIAASGIVRFCDCFNDIDVTAPERFRTTTRVAGAAALVKEAEDYANAGDTKGALERLAVARAGLEIPATEVTPYKGTITLVPKDKGATVAVTGTKTAPFSFPAATTLSVDTTDEAGVVSSYALAVPKSIYPSVVSADLTDKLDGGNLTLFDDRPAIIRIPYANPYTLTSHVGTCTLVGTTLTEVTATFEDDYVEAGDYVVINPSEPTEEIVLIAEVVSQTELVLDSTPVAAGAGIPYCTCAKQYFFVHVGTHSYEVTLPLAKPLATVTPTDLRDWLAGDISNVTVAIAPGFDYIDITTTESGTTLLIDDSSVTRRLGLTDFYDNGAGNTEMTVIVRTSTSISTETKTFTAGTYTPEELRQEIEDTWTIWFSSVELDTDGHCVLTLYGPIADCAMEVTDNDKAQRVFEFYTVDEGVPTSIEAIRTSWDSEGCPVALTESSTHYPVLTFRDVQSVSLSGDGLVSLGINDTQLTASTHVFGTTGLTEGDTLDAGGTTTSVLQVGPGYAVLADALTTDTVTGTLTSGGKALYDATRSELLPYRDTMESLSYGFPAQFWDLLSRQVTAKDRSLAWADIQYYRSLFEDLKVKITGYNPRGAEAVDQSIDKLKENGLDDGVWMLSSLMFNRFFFGDTSTMSSRIQMSRMMSVVLENYFGRRKSS